MRGPHQKVTIVQAVDLRELVEHVWRRLPDLPTLNLRQVAVGDTFGPRFHGSQRQRHRLPSTFEVYAEGFLSVAVGDAHPSILPQTAQNTKHRAVRLALPAMCA